MGETGVDVVVVGAGIVGLATARALLAREPGLRITILEKEAVPAAHQSSHNSGVIHSGIYYTPGSTRALLCRSGRRRMISFAEEHGIEHRRCGKLVVANREGELPLLKNLQERAMANGVEDLARLNSREAREVEPAVDCLEALHVPGTEIIDYGEVVQALSKDLTDAGAHVVLKGELTRGSRSGGEWSLETTRGEVRARFVINCAGLQSDRVTHRLGTDPGGSVIPFRGDYFQVMGEIPKRIRGLVYPVPNPELPFLGVHITPTIHRGILAGPNASLALAREGYGPRDFSIRDLWDTLRFPGFPRFLLGHVRNEVEEVSRSTSVSRMAKELRRMIPSVRESDLRRGLTGIRAQFMDPRGNLIDDFFTRESEGALHVLNAPSPAATASLAIGERLAEQALRGLR